MIFGKWAWTDQAHLPADNVEKLGQLVDTEAAHELANPRDHAGIVAELYTALPLTFQLSIAFEILGQPPFGVRKHRAELVHPERLSAQAFADLGVEHRSGTDNLDQ